MTMTFDEMSELTEEIARRLVEESKHISESMEAPDSVVPAAFLFAAVQSAMNYFQEVVPPGYEMDEENLREVMISAVDLAISYHFGSEFRSDDANLH